MYTFGVSSARFRIEENDHLVRLRRRETDTRLWLRGLAFAGFAAESELLGVVVAVSELVPTDNRGQVTTVRSYMPTVVFDT